MKKYRMIFRVFISIAVLFCRIENISADPRAASEGEIETRMKSGTPLVSSRIIMDWPGVRTGIAVEYGHDGPRFLSGGISAEPITAGTLTPRGLFREMNDPAGYSAASTVFLEPDRYVLDRGFGRISRYGLVVSLPPAGDSCLFLIGNNSGTFSAGLLGVFPLSEKLILSLLTRGEVFSPPGTNENTWFFEGWGKADVPSAGHFAAKVTLKRRMLKLSLSAGGSAAESLVPGGFVRIFGGLKLGGFEMEGFSTLVGTSYFGPAGEYPGSLVAFGVSGIYTPVKPLRVEAMYTRSLGRPGPVPAFNIPSKDMSAVRVGFDWRGFGLRGGWERDFSVEADGTYSGGDTLHAETGIKTNAAETILRGEISLSPYGDTTYAFGARIEIGAGMWSWEAEAGFSFEDEADIEAALTVKIDTGTHVLTAGGTVSFKDVYGVSDGSDFGWEVGAGYKFRMSRAVSK